MKHVLLVHQAFVSPNQAGGTRHYEFARLIVPDGQHKFTIIASTLSYLTGKAGAPEDDANLDEGIQVLRSYTLPVTNRSFVWRVIAFFSFMFSAVWTSFRVKEVDLVMGTTPPIFQAVSAWVIAALRRKPFLLEVRDLWPEFAIDMGVLNNPVLIKLSRWLESFLYSRANHILVNSPAYRDYMLNRGIAPEKVSLIPNGVDPTMFDGPDVRDAVRQELGMGGRFVVSYAGAMGAANDLQVVLKAADRLRDQADIHFLMIGDGKERKNLEAIAQTLKLSNVTFLGSQPKTRMPDFLAASDACLATLMDIPMFRTTYPNKVFDYMAARRPTILGIDGVIREVVEAANAGIFVQPGDDAALADAVLKLHADPDAARQMGDSGRAYVEAHFSRQDHAEAFKQLIDAVAGK